MCQIRWLEPVVTMMRSVQNRVHDIAVQRTIYADYLRIIRVNESLDKTNEFFAFVHICYHRALLVGLRAISESHKGEKSHSLLNVIRRLEKHHPLTRDEWTEAYVSQSPAIPDMMQDVAERHWRQTFGDSDEVTQESLNQDEQTIQDHSAKFKGAVDKEIAHFDPKPKERSLTYGEVDKAIDAILGLAQKYSVLVLQQDLKPIELGNWTVVFDQPWRGPGRA